MQLPGQGQEVGEANGGRVTAIGHAVDLGLPHSMRTSHIQCLQATHDVPGQPSRSLTLTVQRLLTHMEGASSVGCAPRQAAYTLASITTRNLAGTFLNFQPLTAAPIIAGAT